MTSQANVPGLLLRLTGPLQSWGEHSHFNERDTASFPTRSGVIGLLAAALGRNRDQPLGELTALSVTVRADRPGVLTRDFHTVGGGLPNKLTVTTAEGTKRPGDTATLTSHRWYLADAAFTVALTHPDGRPLPDAWATALRAPRWPLYLGRRSCPPEGPLLIGSSDHALHDLIHLPLARHHRPAPPPPHDSGTGRGAAPAVDSVDIDFFSDHPLDVLPVPADGSLTADAARVHSTVNDDPVSYRPRHRSYLSRPLYKRTVPLHIHQCHGFGLRQLAALAAYSSDHFHPLEGSHR
ncbi:type I-E CRISPR-associated protein Cas5/CasD [Streptomyces sp. NPDC047014]|uniref:type I-E CRISPR-associated protein Cas5/CasD n=1 Tax=Streptomyces sp. NPDC047014 TaxID=3155736 RepID=UPI0033F2773B